MFPLRRKEGRKGVQATIANCYSRILGLQLDKKARRYAGIPYALPQTGEYRWRKPRPLPEGYTYGGKGAAYDATEFKPVCPQRTYHVGATGAEGGEEAYSEDCLFVNIWTPVPKPTQQDSTQEKEKSKDKKWPVLLWLHGGWFAMGDPSQESGMDPSELISTGKLNAIVVAIGYRLNVFGFLAGPDLLSDTESDNEGCAAGNFGLWDQRLAAEWVVQNIAFFGGDPGNITLAGRSAGAYIVEAQMLFEFRSASASSISESGKGLYRRFFMDSNAIPAQPKSLTDARTQFDELCAYFNIGLTLSSKMKLSLLRQKPPQDLLSALSHLKNHTFRPVTDKLFIHSGMIEYISSPGFALQFKERNPDEPNVEELKRQVGNYYASDVTERVLERYTLPDPETGDLHGWKRLFGQIIADGQVRAPSRALVHNLVRNGVDVADIWRYQIAYRLSFIDESVAPLEFGIAHAMDKPSWNFSIMYGPTPAERVLMEKWIRNLVAFVNDEAGFEFGTRNVQDF
ncbi:Alpha/Beta hydrolase protein [Aspergillus undulatus]|uniref:Alpha/Beta hydrolase protein n=1 Tax=Aspergillus undulatus TaxID=1810928 RepID=UPI003CCC94FD